MSQVSWGGTVTMAQLKGQLLPSSGAVLSGLPDLVFCVVTLIISIVIIRKNSLRLEKGQKKLMASHRWPAGCSLSDS